MIDMKELIASFGSVSANSYSRDLFLTESPTSIYRKSYQSKQNKAKIL